MNSSNYLNINTNTYKNNEIDDYNYYIPQITVNPATLSHPIINNYDSLINPQNLQNTQNPQTITEFTTTPYSQNERKENPNSSNSNIQTLVSKNPYSNSHSPYLSNNRLVRNSVSSSRFQCSVFRCQYKIDFPETRNLTPAGRNFTFRTTLILFKRGGNLI